MGQVTHRHPIYSLLQVDDSGLYKAKITNSAGEIATEATLDVWKSRPLPETFPFPFKPDEIAGERKRNLGKVPKPSKFIPGEMYHSDYETDLECSIPAKWKAYCSDTEGHYRYKRVSAPKNAGGKTGVPKERQKSPPCPHVWESHEEIDRLEQKLKKSSVNLSSLRNQLLQDKIGVNLEHQQQQQQQQQHQQQKWSKPDVAKLPEISSNERNVRFPTVKLEAPKEEKVENNSFKRMHRRNQSIAQEIFTSNSEKEQKAKVSYPPVIITSDDSDFKSVIDGKSQSSQFSVERKLCEKEERKRVFGIREKIKIIERKLEETHDESESETTSTWIRPEDIPGSLRVLPLEVNKTEEQSSSMLLPAPAIVTTHALTPPKSTQPADYNSSMDEGSQSSHSTVRPKEDETERKKNYVRVKEKIKLLEQKVEESCNESEAETIRPEDIPGSVRVLPTPAKKPGRSSSVDLTSAASQKKHFYYQTNSLNRSSRTHNLVFTRLEPFPFKPEPLEDLTKGPKIPPPTNPTKFIPGKCRESDYESDTSLNIAPKWSPSVKSAEFKSMRRSCPPENSPNHKFVPAPKLIPRFESESKAIQGPPPANPTKFNPGKFRESDYESDTSLNIAPKWSPLTRHGLKKDELNSSYPPESVPQKANLPVPKKVSTSADFDVNPNNNNALSCQFADQLQKSMQESWISQKSSTSASASSTLDRSYWSSSKEGCFFGDMPSLEAMTTSTSSVEMKNDFEARDDLKTPVNDFSQTVDASSEFDEGFISFKQERGYEADTDDTLTRRKTVKEMAKSIQEAENTCPSPWPLTPRSSRNFYVSESEGESEYGSLKRAKFTHSKAYVAPTWAGIVIPKEQQSWA